MQIAPSQILSYRYKQQRSVALKYAKIRFWLGLCPGPRGGAHDASPNLLFSWDGDTVIPPLPHPTRHRPTFGARHASPHNSSQIYAYGSELFAASVESMCVCVCVFCP